MWTLSSAHNELLRSARGTMLALLEVSIPHPVTHEMVHVAVPEPKKFSGFRAKERKNAVKHEQAEQLVLDRYKSRSVRRVMLHNRSDRRYELTKQSCCEYSPARALISCPCCCACSDMA